MPNERLRGSITAAGLHLKDVAKHVEVNQKTVERWIMSGRVPHRTHRWAVAKLLGTDEAYLWPDVMDETRTKVASEAEFIALYPSRIVVPHDRWRSLVDNASDSLDILVYAGLFLPDGGHPDLAGAMIKMGAEGGRVRVLLGDPDGDAVDLRAEEEDIGSSMAARVLLSLNYLKPALGAPGVEVRLHNTTLYNSIYRGDNTMYVNTHVYGAPASQSPVLHLQRVPGGRLFDHYQASFDRVWDLAVPYEPQPKRRTPRREKVS
ncbi:helix-turn-helix domain-containing protein [Fodinicola acaciae]|uniref:helix-turn-helix domain-containing protein n=1 Tax=Fodinicola acaciae TaxID=2681555 RepID=UPI001C9E2B54|nr:helix-turn-helix transcriptional regulator [Fodinicola acaciae]